MQELDEFNNLLQYNYLEFLTFHNCPPIVHEIFDATYRGQIFAEYVKTFPIIISQEVRPFPLE